jgi:hypothetical protein
MTLKDDIMASLVITKLISGAGTFKTIKDIEELYGKLKVIDRPSVSGIVDHVSI